MPARRAIGIRGVSKRFVANQALDDVSFDLPCGEINALVGANGSGKSTLIKILAGVYVADSGSLDVGDRTIDLRGATPAIAAGAGLRFVHQARSTFPDLTVAENLSIGYGWETGPLRNIRERRTVRRAEAVLSRFNLDVDPRAPVRTLGPAAQAILAIARTLQDQDEHAASVLVLDEPTAALPPADVEILLDALRAYARKGTAVMFVSHRLDEVLAIADTVTAIRDGHVVATKTREMLTHDALVELITGRPIVPHVAEGPRQSARKTVFEANEVSGGKVRDVSFTVREGEILGLTGLAGAGTSTILRLIFGAQRVEAGSFVVDGTPLEPGRTDAAIAAGVAFVPGDRAYGIFDSLTVGENLTAGSIRRYWRGWRLRTRDERREARDAMQRFMIRADSPDQGVSQLSGGNQQKVVLARWLRDPRRRLVLLDEPTQGVDVGAKEELWATVKRAARNGAAVIVASSDLEELADVCDRVLIVRRGRIVQALNEQPISVDRLIDRIHTAEVLT